MNMLFRRNMPTTRAGFRFLHYLLLVSGGLVLSVSIFAYAQSFLFQARWSHALGPDLDHRTQISGRGDPPSAKQPIGSLADSREVMGRLAIPRLGFSVIVLEGTDQQTLRLAPGHIENTAQPGDSSNVAIAGHRDTHFRALENIRKGDEISIATSTGDFKYVVQWTRVVGPEDVYVVQPSSVPELTLVTCYPFHYIGSAPKRFIVRALPPRLPHESAGLF
jgi:sortase A